MKKLFAIVLCVALVLIGFMCGYIIRGKFIQIPSPQESYIIISPYIKVETNKDAYAQGENVTITVYLINKWEKRYNNTDF
ncbi:MAG: hypothetical protein AB1485_00380 [Candidatus Thermoplasmatota archaeon]